MIKFSGKKSDRDVWLKESLAKDEYKEYQKLL